ERRARAVEMRRVLPENVLEEIGKLDPMAIAEVQQQAWPDVRNPDELHDVLQTFVAFPTDFNLNGFIELPLWQSYFEQLKSMRRAFVVNCNNKVFWVAAEKAKTFSMIYPQAVLPHDRVDIVEDTGSYEDALLHMIRGWVFHLGPTTNQELAASLMLPLNDVEQAFLKLEASGLILRGKFRQSLELEWCERRLLARIHRQTLSSLRKMIEPVSVQQFIQWLMKWQHRLPGTQLSGEQGLIEIIRQLQGYELPANAWEKQIFATRLTDFDPDMLDRLCMSGVIGWCRLSPHPATLPQSEPVEGNIPIKKSRVTPTSVVPITFFIREESFWMFESLHDMQQDLTGLSSIAQKVHNYLRQRGAAFFADIVRGVDGLKSDVERGLWELVAAGKITADDFDNLRALIDPRRRLRKNLRHRTRYVLSRGRWSLLHTEKLIDSARHAEAACMMLLKRYGIVFRDLLERERNIPTWRELLLAFRRLEDRGEIRGGRFVSGFAGEQFALPFCVDSIRSYKEKADSKTVNIAAVDPLNLIGIVLPGARVSAVSGKTVTIEA
ncbi:MAG TPA: DEAD/DEAH box helicase, partial [Gammaproteobacteria bacterium]|nr:DEAD/DEAH box helicase [Gammaproteobacteria bacterium]